MNNEGSKPLLVDWWNGMSAVLDLSHPNGMKWFKAKLDYLQNKYGVDGLKFDAGDIRFYENGKSYGNISPHQQCQLFNQLAVAYPIAPILVKGAATRKIVLPKGKWEDQNGKIWKGNRTIEYPAKLETIPHFTRLDEQ